MRAPVFSFCSLKSYQVAQGCRVGCACISRLKCSTVPTVSQRLAEQLDRQNRITKTAATTLKDAKSFQDKGAGGVGVRTEEEVQGGGAEKAEKQRGLFLPAPAGGLRHQAALPERASGGGALSAATRWPSPDTSPLFIVCGTATQGWGSDCAVWSIHRVEHTAVCCCSLFPAGLLLGAGNKGESVGTVRLPATTRPEGGTSVSLLNLSGSPVARAPCRVRRASPPLLGTRQKEQVSQAERRDAVAA